MRGFFDGGTEGSDPCVPGNIVGQKAELVDQLNAMDEGFQLVYDNVKAELEKNREGYSAEIKSLQGRITQIMKKNQQYAANYYKTMNKVTSEPVFMDKKK